MMYLGRQELGVEVRIEALCVDASNHPVNPDSAPSIDVWQSGTKVLSGLAMFPEERTKVTGLFVRPLYLKNLTPGRFQVVVRWQSGAFDGMDEHHFEIVPGGNSDGAVMAAVYYEVPNGRFIVHELDSGKIRPGKNPS